MDGTMTVLRAYIVTDSFATASKSRTPMHGSALAAAIASGCCGTR